MSDAHVFEAHLQWPAAESSSSPAHPEVGFSRNTVLGAADKPPVPGSAPTVFGGDATRYNPEELLLMSLAQCHMLTFLAVASKKRIPVLRYEDRASGTLAVGASGKMSMQEVVLRPRVTIAAGFDAAALAGVHDKAHANCFIANSVNFPVRVEPTVADAT